jgi:hypothetical protein
MQLDARALAAATADIVRKHVDEATGPLLRRIEELEARQPDKGDIGERGEAGPTGRDGSDGKDGVGLAAALINRDGELVVTTTDGQIRELGIVVGRDGRDGVDGKDGSTQGETDATVIAERRVKTERLAAMARTPTPARRAVCSIQRPNT